MSQASLCIKATDCLIEGYRRSTALRSSKMQVQTLLTHSGGTILVGGTDKITSIFADRGSESIDYGFMLLHCALSFHHGKPKIIVTTLRLISRRW